MTPHSFHHPHNDYPSSLFYLWKGTTPLPFPHLQVVGNKWEAYLHSLEDDNMDAA